MTQTIRLLLEEKLGRRVRYPKDCDALAVEIEKSVGDRISASTLKRIFGFFGTPTSPSLYTLDVISQFLGFLDWEDLQQKIASHSDSVLLKDSPEILRSEDIAEGTELEIGYSPGRKILLGCTQKGSFRLIESENSTLRQGDILDIQVFMEKFPLYAKTVIRGGRNIGPFIAAKRTGIDYFRVRNEDSEKNTG